MLPYLWKEIKSVKSTKLYLEKCIDFILDSVEYSHQERDEQGGVVQWKESISSSVMCEHGNDSIGRMREKSGVGDREKESEFSGEHWK